MITLPAAMCPNPGHTLRKPPPSRATTTHDADHIEPMLDQFEALVKQRRSTRHFLPDPVVPETIERLMRIAQWAPTAYNAQPVRFIVVTDPTIRPALRRACMDQDQLIEAPAVIVFAGDRNAFEKNFTSIVGQDLAAGAINEDYAKTLLRNTELMFGHGPLGLGWLWKALLVPIARWFRPIPEVPAVHKRFWLAKQVMTCATSFMLAAEAAGLNTIPMEGFDTGRLRSVLDLPLHLEPMLVVPLGYAVPNHSLKTRLPLSQVISWH